MSSKIKDGLFMGDMDAAQDADFLQLNGIMHIINCVPRQVPNIFQQSLGLSYTPCDLEDVLRRPFFDLKNREFMHLIQLIDRALERTESVLVHSLNGVNRSPSIMVGYLMVKYCWGLDKAHEFVMTKRSDMKLHESYIDQLCSLEAQIQENYASRATERQLYEWSTHGVDPRTDEIVLIHTFLNCVSSPDTSGAVDRRRNNGNRRGLTWIDQVLEMRKLYPSLLIRPERPPNHSYSKMAAANGWIDLMDPTPALVQQTKQKQDMSPEVGIATRVAFADLANYAPSSAAVEARARSQPMEQNEMQFDLSDPMAADAGLGQNNKRFHSFSAPKRTVVLEDEASTSPSTFSDREELEFMPEETSMSSNPRYLRQTLASINSRPRRVSSSGPATARTSTSSKRVSLPTNGRSNSSGAILGGTSSTKPATKGLGKKTGRSTSGSTARSSSSTAAAPGRVFFNIDLPPQSSSSSFSSRSRGSNILTGSSRRSLSDPMAQQSQSAPMRPRTAPPRGRKDVETKDLLQSKKVDFTRTAIDLRTSSYRMHSTDYMDISSTATHSTRKTSTPSAYGRTKSARASWR